MTLLRSDPRYQCYGFDAGSKSSSLMLREENDNATIGAGPDADDRRSVASTNVFSGNRSRRISTMSSASSRARAERPSISAPFGSKVSFNPYYF